MERTPHTHPNAWPAFTLADPDGALELAVGEALANGWTRPRKVSAILAAMLAKIDGEPATLSRVRTLSMGAREWLLQQLAATCRPALDWFDCACDSCGTSIDISLEIGAMPQSGVPKGFPKIELECAGETCLFQVVNGATEEALAGARQTGIEGVRLMLTLSACFPDAAQKLAEMSAAALTRLDAQMDALTPDCADSVETACPDCEAKIRARIDPVTYAFPNEAGVLQDVHTLGQHYKWSEREILSLPTRRRRRYVEMIRRTPMGAGQ